MYHTKNMQIYIHIPEKLYTNLKPKLISWICLLPNVSAHSKNTPTNSFYIFRQHRNLLHFNICCIISHYHPQNCCLFINFILSFSKIVFHKPCAKCQYPPWLDRGWRMEQAQHTIYNTDNFVRICNVSQAVQHPWGGSKCYLPSIQLVRSTKMSEHKPEEKCLPVLMLKMRTAMSLLPCTSLQHAEHKGQSHDAS
jgi:hypothetical protein